MLQDKVVLQLEGERVEDFISYSIESHLYTADSAFTLELAPIVNIKEGTRCEIYVNDSLELTGIVDRVELSYSKDDIKLTATGRDLMGLLVDSCCEDFATLEKYTLKQLVEKLIAKVPFISRKNVIYQDGADKLDAPSEFTQIEPGMTIFEALKQFVTAHGLMFWAMPDGTFIFGKPKSKGEPKFRLVCKKDGNENNIIDGSVAKDISKRFSKITIIGQKQGTDELETDQINVQASIEDDDFPFYKPYVASLPSETDDAKKYARHLLEQMRQKGLQLQYKVAGHSQNGVNWRINELCQVEDEIAGINDVYLIYSRTFEKSKQGVYTSLTLGLPGVIAE